MGWVTRANGRRYLYRSRRVNGRVVTEFLGAEGSPRAALLARQWEMDQHAWSRRTSDQLAAEAASGETLRRLAHLDRLTSDVALITVARGLLELAGYHRPNRGDWRMHRGHSPNSDPFATPARPAPAVEYAAPAADTEAVAVFAAARAGDSAAVAQLQSLLRDRGWVDSIGDVGAQATVLLIDRVAKSDPVLRAALRAKAKDLRDELEGDCPTTLEKLLVRRVVNSWLLTHATECELAASADLALADRLDRLLTRAQGRLAAAARELAVVRRLQAPAVLARLQVNVAGRRP